MSRPSTPRLRVAVDATPLIAGDTGVARYTRGLLDHIPPDVEVTTFAVGRGPAVDVDHRVRVPLRAVQAAWRAIGWPRAEQLVDPVDVVHSIDLMAPPSEHPVVMTMHDVLPLTDPQWYGPRFIEQSRRHVESARSAVALVTTCQATADAIADATGITRERIRVAPPGNRRFPNDVTPPPVTGPFLLAVGARTPRKGFQVAAEAMAHVPAPVRLVIAGPPGWRSDEVDAAIARSSARDRIDVLGRVDDVTLAALYHGAEMLVHPSFAEGFGIPALEAMGAGIPVVAGSIPSLVEIGSGVIRFVPAGDPEALAAEIVDLMGDDATRSRLGRAGTERAARFTWAELARTLSDVWWEVSGRSRA